MAVLAPARSKEGPFWLARIIDMKRDAIDSVVHIKYYAKEEDYYVASTIEIVGIGAIMGPVNLDQDGEKFYLDEEQENLWTSTANMSRTTIATTSRRVMAAKRPQDEEDDEFSIPATATAQPTTVSRHGRVRKITRKAQGLAAIKNSSSGRRGGIRGGGRGVVELMGGIVAGIVVAKM